MPGSTPTLVPLIAASLEGELIAARARFWVVSVASFVPAAILFFHPQEREPWVGLGAALITAVLAGALWRVASRASVPRWLPLVSSLFDVACVSLMHLAFALVGRPLAATNGRVFFSGYLLVLTATCLRLNVKVTIAAGLSAMAEYLALSVWVRTRFDLAAAAADSNYGVFRWDTQLARLSILALATALDVVVVRQMVIFVRASLDDPLTGLANRRFALVRMRDALAVARRMGRTAVLALGDLDRFKEVNDAFGHPAGDEALREVAARMRRFFRETDVLARFGGEEFLIFFPEAEISGALERIERFHRSFADEPLRLGQGRQLPVTMSIGVAAFPLDGGSVNELLSIADVRLYEAKNGGRNLVRAPQLTIGDSRSDSSAVGGT